MNTYPGANSGLGSRVVKFSCPHCGQRISTAERDVGITGECPACKRTFTVPGLGEGAVLVLAPEEVGGARRGRSRLSLALLAVLLLLAGAVAFGGKWLWQREALAEAEVAADRAMESGPAETEPAPVPEPPNPPEPAAPEAAPAPPAPPAPSPASTPGPSGEIDAGPWKVAAAALLGTAPVEAGVSLSRLLPAAARDRAAYLWLALDFDETPREADLAGFALSGAEEARRLPALEGDGTRRVLVFESSSGFVRGAGLRLAGLGEEAEIRTPDRLGMPEGMGPLVLGEVDGARLAAAAAGERLAVDLGGGERIVFCGIPPGQFAMGSPPGESGRSDDERQHTVILSERFWLARTECTQGQWEAVMGTNPSQSKGSDLPVENVSWADAAEFCRKLTERERSAGRLPEGWEFALPTEVRWEYACRAGSEGPYAGDLGAMGWYAENSGGKTHPAGGKAANAWGLCDMHGNVWEWCADWYGEYPGEVVRDPPGPPSGSIRVDRGGGWDCTAPLCRSADRSWDTPDSRIDYLGFRPAAVPAGR